MPLVPVTDAARITTARATTLDKLGKVFGSPVTPDDVAAFAAALQTKVATDVNGIVGIPIEVPADVNKEGEPTGSMAPKAQAAVASFAVAVNGVCTTLPAGYVVGTGSNPGATAATRTPFLRIRKSDDQS